MRSVRSRCQFEWRDPNLGVVRTVFSYTCRELWAAHSDSCMWSKSQPWSIVEYPIWSSEVLCMFRDYSHVVIGAGALGSATAFWSADRGATDVLVLELFALHPTLVPPRPIPGSSGTRTTVRSTRH